MICSSQYFSIYFCRNTHRVNLIFFSSLTAIQYRVKILLFSWLGSVHSVTLEFLRSERTKVMGKIPCNKMEPYWMDADYRRSRLWRSSCHRQYKFERTCFFSSQTRLTLHPSLSTILRHHRARTRKGILAHEQRRVSCTLGLFFVRCAKVIH